jgi:hypothetical protein
MRDHLSIALGREAMSTRSKAISQLPVVVDLPIEYDRDGAILVMDGLVAGGEVNDPQTLDPKTDWTLNVNTTCIGAPVLEASAHGVNQLGGYRLPVAASLSDDAAHRLIPQVSSRRHD